MLTFERDTLVFDFAGNLEGEFIDLVVLIATDNTYYPQRPKLITDIIVRSSRLIRGDRFFLSVTAIWFVCL
jgi:hypothetical protein